MIQVTENFTYQESQYDGVAQIDSVKGNTVVFNQHIQNGDFADSTDWVGNNASISVSSNVLTGTVTTSHATAGLKKVSNISFIANHQYLVSATVSCSVASDNCVARFFATGNDFTSSAVSISANTKKRVSWIITPTNSFSGAFYLYPKFSYSSPLALNSTFTYSNVVLIDLTQLADSRVTDYDSFVKYYPLSYYSYTQGELVSFNGNAIKTVGFNQWDEEWEQGTINAQGQPVDDLNNIRSKNFIPVLASTEYYAKCPSTVYVLAYYYDGNQNFISGAVTVGNQTFTTPSNCCYLKIRTGSYGGTYNNDICINISDLSKNGTYEPYTSSTTSIPTSTYFPTGMKSAGSVYDELSNNKAITRVGVANLGSFNWTMYSVTQGNLFRSPNLSTIGYALAYDSINLICALYPTVKASQRIDKSISVGSNGCVDIIDSTYNDATAFKTAMSGVYLYYELATPLENYAVFDVKYDIHKGGTEELLPSALLNGVVDLGTLAWTYSSADTSHPLGFFYTTSLSDRKSGATNVMCDKYVTTTSWSTDKSIQGNANNFALYIVDSAYTDAVSFKNSLQGVMLYYEKSSSIPSTSAFFGVLKIYSQIESLVPYRTFWLVNGNGDRWDFTKHELKSFLNEPQGLGFQKTIDITRYGERAVKNSETYNFPTVSGDLLFYDSPNSTRYEKYNEFVRFLMNQPITLYYQIPVSVYSRIADIYTLNCEVMSLTKTESKPERVLTSNISMSGLGFYQGDEVTIAGDGTSYTINNDGDFPVGFEIEINGSLTNPYFTLEQDGEMYGEAKFDDSTAFDSVYVNSKDGEQNVVLEQGGSILPNPLSYQDLSISNGSIYVTFVKLAMGESTLTIGIDSGSVTSLSVKFIPTYRSV